VQRLEEEAFGGLGIPCRTQEKLQRVPLRIDRPVEVHPGFSDFDVGFIHFPGIVAGFQVRPTAFVELWGVSLYPTIDGGMIDRESALDHHLFQVTVAERIPEVPTDAQENDLGFKVTPFERTRVLHEGNSFGVLE
jgi:hypothetical protein